MSTYLHGSFRNRDNQDIMVEIRSPYGLGEYYIGENDNSPIKFAKNPIEITTECDDMFTHIIKKECTITLITKLFLGSMLFTGDDRNVTVKVYNHNSCLFMGYVKPKSFSQAWANEQEEFEIKAFDYLSTLENHYLTDMTSYKTLKSQNNVLSFKDYLSRILPTYTWYDNSKKIDSYNNIFETCGVSMNVFLGDDEDKLMNNEEILEAILMFLNLHIMQDGNNIFIFDWKTMGIGAVIWSNLFSGDNIDMPSNTIEVQKEDYASTDTNVSMADLYNRISVKAKFEKKDEVGTESLSDKEVQFYNNYKQLYFSELKCYGDGSTSREAFIDLLKKIDVDLEHLENSWDGWERNDYYMKWGYNPNWKLFYKNQPIESYLEYDNAGNVINQQRIMQFLRTNPFMPAIVSIGKYDKPINWKKSTRLNSDGTGVSGKIDMKNYLVISVNGNLDDSDAEWERINQRIKLACSNTTDAFTSAKGLLSYEGDSGLFSPADDETTNYLIFSGSIMLNPVVEQSPWVPFLGQGMYVPKSDSIKLSTHIEAAKKNSLPDNVMVTKDDWGRYAQMYYTCADPTKSLEQLDKNALMTYPFIDDKHQELEYNYSKHWDDSDQINKLEILVCQMKIGDKYLVETTNGDRKRPKYAWLTYEECPIFDGEKKTTFTIGPDIEHEDCIIGKEYEICNTADGRYTNNKGLAIPIKKSDALSGDVSFKILSVCNGRFNEIVRTHPTLFRHTSWDDNWKNILSHVSSIWLKEFKIYIVSDNKGYDVANDNTDLVYYSEENHNSIEKHDDIEFTLNTQPPTDLLLEHGIGSNVSNSNVINMFDNTSVQEIHEKLTNETAIAEHLYINQYYQQYSVPRLIVESTLKYNYAHPMLQMFQYTNIKDEPIDTVPLSSTYNVKDNTITMTSIQVG